MKALGIVILIIGAIWTLVAINTDTTITTESQTIGGVYIPSQTVHNIGKMDERRNNLILSSLVIIVGVIFFAVGKSKEQFTSTQTEARTNPGAGNRKCPFCAEFVKSEALICRYCHKELPPILKGTCDNPEELLLSRGYKVTKKGNSWVVREPLGARVVIKTEGEFIEYANSKKYQNS